MIFSYNDTKKTPWNLMNRNNNFLRLCNMSTSSLHIDVNVADREGAIQKANLKMGVVAPAVERAVVQKLYDGNTNIIFNRKNNDPFIRGGVKGNRNVALVSIDMEGKVVRSVYTRTAMIFDGAFEAGSHLEMICSVPFEESRISIVVTDDKNAYSYSIFADRETSDIRVIKRVCPLDRIPAKGERGYINTTDFMKGKTSGRLPKFKPSRVTCANILLDAPTVLSDEEAIKTLSEQYRIPADNLIIKRCFAQTQTTDEGHTITSHDFKGMDELQKEYFTAVTIQVPVEYTGELKDVESDPAIKSVLDEAAERFDNIMLVNHTFDRVYRYKVA